MMTRKDTIEKLERLSEGEISGWKAEAAYRKANKAWLDKSSQIALRILRHLKDHRISQAELADKLAISPQMVSKIIKGKENLTLETISNIETVLGIELIAIPKYLTPTVSIKYIVKEKLIITALKRSTGVIRRKDSMASVSGFYKESSNPYILS